MTTENITPAKPGPNRRAQGISSLLLVAAAVLLWASSRMRWAEVIGEDGLSPAKTFEVLGSDWSPWLTGVAALFAAGIIAQFAVRGWLLRGVAVIIAVAAVLSMIPAITLIRDGATSLYAADAVGVPDRYEVVAVIAHVNAGYVLIAGAVCAVIAAVFMMRSASSAGMSSKYSSPAARQAEIERQVFAERERRLAAEAAGEDTTSDAADANERLLWDSLDNGIDPTDDRPR